MPRRCSLLGVGFAAALFALLGVVLPASAGPLRVHPSRLRVRMNWSKTTGAFAVMNRTRNNYTIQTISVPRELEVKMTIYREGSRYPVLVRKRATEGRFVRLQNGGFLVRPGGMFTFLVRGKGGAAAQRTIKIRYQDKGTRRYHTATISVQTYNAIKPAQCRTRNDVCFIAFGDQGTGNDNQRRVGKAMAKWQAHNRTDFVVGLGDNFYMGPLGIGLTVFDSKQFKKRFEDMYPYPMMKQKFYMSAGNHDHYGNAAVLIKYTKSRKKWCTRRWTMPGRWYTYRKGPVQFFVLDTPRMDRDPRFRGGALLFMNKMLEWFKNELAKSTAKWKVVYGHHPVFNYGGDHATQLGAIVERLLPLLHRYKVDLHLGGHEHDQQHIRRSSYKQFRNLDNIDFVISGSAGKSSGKHHKGEFSKFASSALGFSYFKISGDTLTMQILQALPNGTPKVMYTFTRRKSPSWRYRAVESVVNRVETAVRRTTRATTGRTRYQIQWTTMYGGRTLRSFTPRRRGHLACQDACTADRRCRAFTFFTSRKRCLLKASTHNRRRQRGAISGVKR